MKRTNAFVTALEDIDAEIEIEITEEGEDQALDVGIPGGNADLDFEGDMTESLAEDQDVAELVESVDAMESIHDMIMAMPVVNGKIAKSVLGGIRIACEANELVAANSDALVGDGVQKEAGGRFREAIRKILEVLAGMAKGFLETIQKAWAQATDKLTRAGNAAKAAKQQIGSTQFTANASISDEKLTAVFATAGNIGVSAALSNSFEFAKAMGGRSSSELLNSAGEALKQIAAGNGTAATEKLQAAITAIRDVYPETTNINGSEASASKPLFSGMRAWIRTPDSFENIDRFMHGVSKVDNVHGDSQGSMKAGGQQELSSICDMIIAMQPLVAGYKSKLAEEQRLASTISGTKTASADDEATNKQLTKLQSALPKILKGPQVTAYGYAGTAAAIAMRFVTESLKAQAGGGETQAVAAPAEGAAPAAPATA